MTLRVIAGFAAVACISICGLLATFTNFKIVEEVNRKLPESEKFTPLGWYLSKYQRLRREYKRFYPGGRLLLRLRTLAALMAVCLFAAAWCFGLFTK